MYVPYQLERLMWIGTLICLTSFLVRSPDASCRSRVPRPLRSGHA
jgi:hypothetical protein